MFAPLNFKVFLFVYWKTCVKNQKLNDSIRPHYLYSIILKACLLVIQKNSCTFFKNTFSQSEIRFWDKF
ncbi:hypothetical protein BpHYR1_046913 [Brachionus plicatilis]|uniref:Uncharacterized protein n=1 Tax=Brachionus plicatilis TaxID=10195 RepID=A0A3M7RIR8_BRAPC|nr:hypothetical protein BpHYR1_046913 [Brachionus plicatilis]